jgi:prolipoprotein diacylglyceryltransferase
LKIPVGNPAIPQGFSPDSLYHPTFLYEFLLNLVAFAALLLLDRKFELRWGKLFALYLVFYSSIRFFVEGIRLDPSAVFNGLRTNQWSAVFGILIGLAFFYVQSRRHTGIEPSVTLEPRAKPKAKPKAKPSTTSKQK